MPKPDLITSMITVRTDGTTGLLQAFAPPINLNGLKRLRFTLELTAFTNDRLSIKNGWRYYQDLNGAPAAANVGGQSVSGADMTPRILYGTWVTAPDYRYLVPCVFAYNASGGDELYGSVISRLELDWA